MFGDRSPGGEILASVALSITGAILSAIGGFAIGFASGINIAVMEIVSSATNIVSLFPVIGPALASEITNYFQSKLTNYLAESYVVGALSLVVGLVLSVYGGKKKTSLKSMAPATVPTTTQRFCTKCGNRLGIDDKFCSSCGQAIS